MVLQWHHSKLKAVKTPLKEKFGVKWVTLNVLKLDNEYELLSNSPTPFLTPKTALLVEAPNMPTVLGLGA